MVSMIGITFVIGTIAFAYTFGYLNGKSNELFGLFKKWGIALWKKIEKMQEGEKHGTNSKNNSNNNNDSEYNFCFGSGL